MITPNSNIVSIPALLSPTPFSALETHRIFMREDHLVQKTSEGTGWNKMFVSAQRELAFDTECKSVDDHLIVLQLNGQNPIIYTTEGMSQKAVGVNGSITVVPAGTEFRIKTETDVDSIHLYVRHQLVESIIAETSTKEPGLITLKPVLACSDPLLQQLVLSCLEVLNQPDLSDSLYVDHLAWAIAAHLVYIYGTKPVYKQSVQGSNHGDNRRLKRVIDYIDENLSCQITIHDLADAAALSPVYFTRWFKQKINYSPYKYVLHLRIERAKHMLCSDNLSISEIAISCGFCHQEHFTNAFRKLCKTTPASYRKNRYR